MATEKILRFHGGSKVAYEVLDLPLEPWRLHIPNYAEPLSDNEGDDYCAWVKMMETRRVGYSTTVLGDLGADLTPEPRCLRNLSQEVLDWLPRMIRICTARQFSMAWLSPPSDRYSFELDRMLPSFAHDLAFVVMQFARAGAHLTWARCDAPLGLTGRWRHYRYNAPMILPTAPDVLPISEVSGWLQSILVLNFGNAPPGAYAHFKSRFGHFLWYLYSLLSGTGQDELGLKVARTPSQLGVARPAPFGERIRLRAARSVPHARLTILNVLPTIRAAGFYSRFAALDDQSLARRIEATWNGVDLRWAVDDPANVGYGVVALDSDRAILDAVRDVYPGNQVYVAFLRSLARITGDTVRLRALREEWNEDLDTVRLTFQIDAAGTARSASIVVDAPSSRLNPAVVVRFNELLQPDGSYWFVDPSAENEVFFCWATSEEQRLLRDELGLRCQREPPGWWVP
jgi:hypothetical protein